MTTASLDEIDDVESRFNMSSSETDVAAASTDATECHSNGSGVAGISSRGDGRSSTSEIVRGPSSSPVCVARERVFGGRGG